ncbi:MAG: hypothetical protein IPI61_01505 [Syntrophaceae bacterium]|nr:hypothetical protein [Syntrophaceae bacterium]
MLMFEIPLSEYLRAEHELMRAARLIDWEGLHDALSMYYSPLGRTGKPIRQMVGIHLPNLLHQFSKNRNQNTALKTAFIRTD